MKGKKIMNLPKIETATYELTVPSSNEIIKYRPFLVKEEKILLMTKESENPDALEISVVIKQIVNNCILSDVNINDLATFDLEYIFINLRSKSVGNTVDLIYDHDCPNDEKTKNIPFIVNLDDVVVEDIKPDNSIIQITDTVSIIMKYPDYDLIKDLYSNNEDNNKKIEDIEIVIRSMKYIIDNDTKHLVTNYSTEEITEFLESLTSNQFKKIFSFFNTMPATSYRTELKCEHCDFTHDAHLTGIVDFFV